MIWKDKELNTMGDVFKTALDVAKRTPGKCNDFLEAYAQEIAEDNGCSKEESLKIAKSNLGYFAGYYDTKTAKLIQDRYGAVHPIFGGL